MSDVASPDAKLENSRIPRAANRHDAPASSVKPSIGSKLRRALTALIGLEPESELASVRAGASAHRVRIEHQVATLVFFAGEIGTPYPRNQQ